MKLIPNTLFARSALLIAMLIILSQIAMTVFFLQWVQRPRLRVMLEIAESHLQSVRVAMALLPEEKRLLYLEQMSQNNRIHLQKQAPDIESSDEKPPFVIKRFLRLFEKSLTRTNGLYTKPPPKKLFGCKFMSGNNLIGSHFRYPPSVMALTNSGWDWGG